MKYIYLFCFAFTFLLSNSQNSIVIEKKLLFEVNQSNLSTNALSSLDSLVKVCAKYSNYSIKIVGYTDPSGSLQYNQKLSANRAKTVFDYFIEKNINPSFLSQRGYGVDTKSINETIQRNTTVTFSAKLIDCFYKLNSVTGKNGTQVSMRIKNDSTAILSLEEYFSTQSMLTDKKFALDVNDEVLETAGMISVDLKDINPDDIEDGVVTISIPTISNADYDEEMTVWVEEIYENGERRWKNIKLKPRWNKDLKQYQFSLNVSSFKNNKISINLDKNIYREQTKNVSTGKNKKVIIVTTENDEFFYDVYLSYKSEKQNDLKFSAKMDKTGFAFVIPKIVNPKKLFFTGINSSGKITFNLMECKVSKYKNKYPLYKYFKVSSSNKKMENEKDKKKGFWQWLKRVFS